VKGFGMKKVIMLSLFMLTAPSLFSMDPNIRINPVTGETERRFIIHGTNEQGNPITQIIWVQQQSDIIE
jgi:hypothetical protein